MQGLFPSGTGPTVQYSPRHALCDAFISFQLLIFFQLSSKTYALPAGAQPVPIHSADTHNDPLLYGYKICPRCVHKWLQIVTDLLQTQAPQEDSARLACVRDP